MTVRAVPAGPGPSAPRRSRTGAVLAATAAALAAAALYNGTVNLMTLAEES